MKSAIQGFIQCLVFCAGVAVAAPFLVGTPLNHWMVYTAIGGGAAALYTIWSVRRQMRRDGDKGRIHSITPGHDQSP